MSNFVVSARKYRPIRFDSVVGQQHVSQTLKNAIINDHLAQAFLFCGPRGVGKTTCARILAKVLNCEQPTEDKEPCDTCNSCTSFRKNASLNIHELDAASNNSVEHIRALIEQVRFAPQSGKYKIYIIDEVHMLSQSAFNAFLKTLEEPPSYAIFILATTEKHKIIPTILSRCQIFDFNRIQVADMTAHLQHICSQEKITAEEEALNIIAQKADGALRDSLSIFDRIVSFAGNTIRYQDVIENLNILDYDYYFKVVDGLMAEDSSSILLLFDQISRKGFDGDLFINGLAAHLRNLLVCQDPKTITLLEVSGSIRQRYQEQASLVPKGLLLTALSLANACDINYKMARNKRLHVEMALLKMTYIQRAMQPQLIVQETTPAPQVQPAPVSPTVETNQTPSTKVSNSPDPIAKVPPAAKKTPPPVASIAKEQTEAPKNAAKQSFKEKMAQRKGKGMMTKMYQEVEAEKAEEQVEKAPFTQLEIEEIWNKNWEAIESPSTQLLFKTAVVTIMDTTPPAIHILASGNRAKDAIAKASALKQKMILHFGLKTIDFNIDLNEHPEEPKDTRPQLPNSDREKYMYFLERNPALKDFQKRFGLLPPKSK